jgi:hypothetical protein
VFIRGEKIFGVVAGRAALVLLNEPDRHRVAIEFSIAGLDGGDDDEDGVQDPKDRDLDSKECGLRKSDCGKESKWFGDQNRASQQ